MVHFEFAGGARGCWDASRYHESTAADPRYTFGEFTIEANAGAIRLQPDGQLTVQRLGEREMAVDYPHGRRNFASDCVFATQSHFIECLRSGAEFETSGADYLQTLLVQEAIYDSAERGQPVRGLATGAPDAHR